MVGSLSCVGIGEAEGSCTHALQHIVCCRVGVGNDVWCEVIVFSRCY